MSACLPSVWCHLHLHSRAGGQAWNSASAYMRILLLQCSCASVIEYYKLILDAISKILRDPYLLLQVGMLVS